MIWISIEIRQRDGTWSASKTKITWKIIMKRIGILGGLGPESTVDYYKEIITAFNTKYTESAYPEIIVYSANLKEFMGFVESGRWNELSAWLILSEPGFWGMMWMRSPT